jgi:Uma2 family endonuclease
MSSPLQRPMTREAFFAWAEAQEGTYEFDGFQPVAMTRSDLGHSVLIGNINRQLGNRLAGTKCRSLGPEAGVATGHNGVRYPGVVVTCTPFNRRDRLVPDPIIVFEVVSPSSARIDRLVKLREYQAVPTIPRYVIVEPGTAVLTVLSRDKPDEMFRTIALGEDDILALPEIGVEIPIVAIYEGIELDEQQDAG